MKDARSHAKDSDSAGGGGTAVEISPGHSPAATPSKGKVRVLLVDDHPMVRQGLSRLINDEADLCVCGEADSASAALGMLDSVQPDLAIVDISMDGIDGIELVKELRAKRPQMPTLVLSM